MGFLDIRGLNIVQTPGGKGWNPAKTVPLCARAYICRLLPLGPLGAILKEGSTSGALVPFDAGAAPHLSP